MMLYVAASEWAHFITKRLISYPVNLKWSTFLNLHSTFSCEVAGWELREAQGPTTLLTPSWHVPKRFHVSPATVQ